MACAIRPEHAATPAFEAAPDFHASHKKVAEDAARAVQFVRHGAWAFRNNSRLEDWRVSG